MSHSYPFCVKDISISGDYPFNAERLINTSRREPFKN
jgi:hypothetical protein